MKKTTSLNDSIQPGDTLYNFNGLFEQNEWFLLIKNTKRNWTFLSLITNKTYVWYLDSSEIAAKIFFQWMKKVPLEEMKQKTMEGKEKE